MYRTARSSSTKRIVRPESGSAGEVIPSLGRAWLTGLVTNLAQGGAVGQGRSRSVRLRTTGLGRSGFKWGGKSRFERPRSARRSAQPAAAFLPILRNLLSGCTKSRRMRTPRWQSPSLSDPARYLSPNKSKAYSPNSRTAMGYHFGITLADQPLSAGRSWAYR
jgi:hypothetical protein